MENNEKIPTAREILDFTNKAAMLHPMEAMVKLEGATLKSFIALMKYQKYDTLSANIRK